MTNEAATRPPIADQPTFQAELDKLRAREKAHTREGDAIAAARRRLPMVERDATTPLTGPDGPLTLLVRRLRPGPLPRAPATAPSWAGTCPGTRPRNPVTALLPPPRQPGMMHLVCYLRDGDRVFETYWTTLRGVEAMDNSYALMDLTAYGRQESWEDSPAGWSQACTNTRTMDGSPTWTPVPEWPAGRPIPQWQRLAAGHSDDLGTT
jgi:Bacterial protein of unknown function (DUF899)